MRRFWSLAGAVGFGMLGLLAARGPAQSPGFVALPPPAGAPAGAPAGSEDVTAPYAVMPEAGTWMICAHSYAGPTARILALQLTEEIRNKQRVPAYIFNHASAERRRMDEEYLRECQIATARGLPPPRHRIPLHVEEQCAVLVGGPGAGWATVEEASSYLKKVRRWPMPELHLEDGLTAYDMKVPNNKSATLVALAGSSKARDGQPINPFENCFVTRNPTALQASPQQAKFDPIWPKLNAAEDYSLLKCPQPWTLVVKEYQGGGQLRGPKGSSGFLDNLLGNHPSGEGLSAAAAQAHALAEFLHKLGFQTYVLHMRSSSIVTVGAFRAMDDPELARTRDRLARLSFQPDMKNPNANLFARSNLELWQNPLPMEVPHP
jgi:hypothetical protein